MQTGEGLLGMLPDVHLSLRLRGEEGYQGQDEAEPTLPSFSLSEVIAGTSSQKLYPGR